MAATHDQTGWMQADCSVWLAAHIKPRDTGHWTPWVMSPMSLLTYMFTISLRTSSKILPREAPVLVLGMVLTSHLRSLFTAAGLGALCRTRCRLQTVAGLSCERGLSTAARPPLLPGHRLGLVCADHCSLLACVPVCGVSAVLQGRAA